MKKETIEGPTPHMNLIFGIFLGLLFLGIAGSLAWIFYESYISETSRVGYVDEIYRLYLKDSGTVVGKEIIDGKYTLSFTYPGQQGTYQGKKQVSRREYEEAQPGDKFSIFYNPANPAKWLLPTRGNIGWGAIALIIAFGVTFLIGLSIVIQTLRTFLGSR
ncbi:MAG: DUF3592 domain-containing protein [Blastocatellia bacterium]|nr:DUF3592 domain-containing protein [Blastocatellia bacterium]